MASLAECAGGQCNRLCCGDLAADLIQERLGCSLTPDMARRSGQRFAASFGITANSSSICATMGVAIGSRGFGCTAGMYPPICPPHKVVAGHSNISISQRYVHPSEDAVLNALSRLTGHNSGHTAENVIPGGSGEWLLNTANHEG